MNENFTAELPEKFTRNALDLCGESGARWLNELLRITGEIEARWAVKAENPFPNLSYNYVASCVRADGSRKVSSATSVTKSLFF